MVRKNPGKEAETRVQRRRRTGEARKKVSGERVGSDKEERYRKITK